MAKQDSARRTRRRAHKTLRKRHSAFGRIMPPVDVRGKADVDALMKRISKGPLTIVLVYADWCGHCKTFMPHFDKASNSSARSVQTAKINETVLNDVNNALYKNNSVAPISVEGYPTVLALNSKGEKVSELEAVRDSATMTKVMNEAGNLAKKSISMNMNANMNVNARMNNNVNHSEPEIIASLPQIVSSAPAAAEEAPVEPPVLANDVLATSVNVQRGGSLYGTLASSAYKLAPAGILLGMAALSKKRGGKRVTIKRRRSHHRKL